MLINKLLINHGFVFPKDCSYKNIQLLLDLDCKPIVKITDMNNKPIFLNRIGCYLSYAYNIDVPYAIKTFSLHALSISEIKTVLWIVKGFLNSNLYNIKCFPNIAIDLIICEQFKEIKVLRQELININKNEY